MRRDARAASALLPALLLAAAAGGAKEEAALTGRQIMEKAADASGLGIRNGTAKVRMVLVEKGGAARERAFTFKSKESGGERKVIMKFSSPADVAGTGLLVVEKQGGAQEQYLYLPETGKVRKISGKQSHASFLSSDFLYWDLRRHDPADAEHERLPDETVSGVACRVVASVPHADAGAPYGKVVSWVAAASDVPVKLELSNAKGKLVKRLVNTKIEKKEGRWVVMSSQMKDLASGHVTKIEVDSVEFTQGLPDDDFTKAALTRVD